MPNSAQQSQDHKNALDSARSHVQICSPTERYDQGRGIPSQDHSLHDDGRQNYASPQGSKQRSQHVDCSEQHATRSPRINGRVNRTILHSLVRGGNPLLDIKGIILIGHSLRSRECIKALLDTAISSRQSLSLRCQQLSSSEEGCAEFSSSRSCKQKYELGERSNSSRSPIRIPLCWGLSGEVI
ncbi:Uncharacterized protein Fot_48700 [Forsythia ovata]|uniref:Uncharacterized protein n=1 Tax=Forsythia ovata TaxID=205694 RepID=A0ABD1QAR6_9LAMI